MTLENKFFKVIPFSKQLYKLETFLTPSPQINSNVILHKKLVNTYSPSSKTKPILNSETVFNEKIPTRGTIEKKLNNEKPKKKIKSQELKRERPKKVQKYVLLSTVKKFDILRPLLAKLKLTKMKNLFKRLKAYKKNKKHIMFYLKNHRLFLILKGIHFKKNMKTFYNLLLKN